VGGSGWCQCHDDEIMVAAVLVNEVRVSETGVRSGRVIGGAAGVYATMMIWWC